MYLYEDFRNACDYYDFAISKYKMFIRNFRFILNILVKGNLLTLYCSYHREYSIIFIKVFSLLQMEVLKRNTLK